MSVAAPDNRKERLKWLLRPFDWALHVTVYTAIVVLLTWTDPEITSLTDDFVAVLSITASLTVAGLLIWGTRRILYIARGL